MCEKYGDFDNLSDVIEAVNQATTGNQVTLHTTAGCSMDVKREETGTVLSTDCLNSTDSNAGCGVQGHEHTYGQALNKIGGGVSNLYLPCLGMMANTPVRFTQWNFGMPASAHGSSLARLSQRTSAPAMLLLIHLVGVLHLLTFHRRTAASVHTSQTRA